MPSLIAILGANISPFVAQMERAGQVAKKQGSEIAGKMGSGLGGKLAGFASVGALTMAVEKTVEYGSKINDLSLRLGISTDAVQQWDFALKQNGSSIEAGASFFEKLATSRKKALGGNEDAIASFAKLGVSMDQLKTGRLEDIGVVIQRAFETGDPQELVASLKEVGGRGAGEMITAFRSGFGELMAGAPLIKPEDIAALDELGDKWQELKSNAIAGIAGPLVFLFHMVEEITYLFQRLLGIVVGAVSGLGSGLGKTWEALKSGDVLGVLKQTVGGGMVKDVFGGIGDTMQAMDDADRVKSMQDAQAQAKKDDARKHGPLEETESESSEKKKAAAAEKAAAIHRAHMDKIVKLEETLAKKKEENALKLQTNAQKILELEAKRAALAGKTMEAGSEADLERQIEIADVDKSIQEAKKKSKTDEERELGQYKLSRGGKEVNSLQRIGLFLGNYSQTPEAAILDVNKKSERHLDAIRKALEKRGINPGEAGADDSY